MSTIEEMVSELEGIGAIGNKVVMLKQPSKAGPEVAEESASEETKPVAEPETPKTEALLRERLATLSQKADEKLAAVIDAVQDLRSVFQELHEATQGDADAEISEEA
jgi:hypothetical protein